MHRDVALEIIGTKECGPINLLDVWLTKDALTRYAVRKLAEGGRDGTMRAGIAYQMAGDHEGAFAAYEKVLQEERNNLDVYNRLAVIAPQGMTVYAFGEAVPFTDVHPLIVNGRTMVPVRAVTEAIGAEVEWDPGTSTATFTVPGKAPVRITQGTNVARVGDLYVPLDVEPTVVPPGRFVVPLRFLSESFGYDVRWHSFTPGHAVISIREAGAR